MIDLLAHGLFWCHVFSRAHDVAQRRVRRAAEELRDSEIGELDGGRVVGIATGSVGDEQVRGLEIAMHDAVVVGHLERPCDLSGDRKRLPPREPAASSQDLLEALAPDQLHRKVGLVVLLPKCQQPHDSWVPQALERVDLGLESTPQSGVVGQVRGQYFYGDGATSGRIDRLVHGTHAAAAKPGLDRVRAQVSRLHDHQCSRRNGISTGRLNGQRCDCGSSCTTAASLRYQCRSPQPA